MEIENGPKDDIEMDKTPVDLSVDPDNDEEKEKQLYKERHPDPVSDVLGIFKFWESILAKEPPAEKVVSAEDYPGVFGGALAAIDNHFRITDRGSSFYFEFTGESL